MLRHREPPEVAVDAGVVPQDEGVSFDVPTNNDDGAASSGLPILHVADQERAARGKTLLHEGGLVSPNIPMRAIENLWLVWGTGRPVASPATPTASRVS